MRESTVCSQGARWGLTQCWPYLLGLLASPQKTVLLGHNNLCVHNALVPLHYTWLRTKQYFRFRSEGLSLCCSFPSNLNSLFILDLLHQHCWPLFCSNNDLTQITLIRPCAKLFTGQSFVSYLLPLHKVSYWASFLSRTSFLYKTDFGMWSNPLGIDVEYEVLSWYLHVFLNLSFSACSKDRSIN